VTWPSGSSGCHDLKSAIALIVELRFFGKQVEKGKGPDGTLSEQGAVSGAVDAVSKLATAIKDLKASAQLFVLSIAFLSIAAVAAGLDAVAGAVK
jgi:hypothetical protein